LLCTIQQQIISINYSVTNDDLLTSYMTVNPFQFLLDYLIDYS